MDNPRWMTTKDWGFLPRFLVLTYGRDNNTGKSRSDRLWTFALLSKKLRG